VHEKFVESGKSSPKLEHVTDNKDLSVPEQKRAK
jgi:hypothetical protein